MEEKTPLKWPDGWKRTLLDQRKTRAQWKKPYSFYREQVTKELERLGATTVLIYRQEQHQERLDPGVAVWFSMKKEADFSWQITLQLDNPMPTIAEIDEAYRRLVQKHHPDRISNGSGGDIQIFHRLSEARDKARAWILGDNAPKLENCIPFDRYVDARQNMAAIASALRHFRGLEALGMPAILERVMDKAFKTALPKHEEMRREPVTA